jgi:Asp-tRNA(Asn)/Glu-tRNA(Gln) amidotransferase A subunit family amidase
MYDSCLDEAREVDLSRRSTPIGSKLRLLEGIPVSLKDTLDVEGA